MSWGFPRGSATYGAPVSGKSARMRANGGKDSRNGYSRGKSQRGRGKGRARGGDSKAPGRGGAAAGWGRWC